MSETAKRTVLITGSNRGIGKAMLLAAAQNGYDIIAHARKPNAEWKDTLLAASENYGVGIHDIYFDLSSPEQIKQAFSELYKAHLSVDLLINNAGITSYNTSFMMTSINTAREMFEINLFAMMQITQYCLKSMIRKKYGSIVNIASICGEDVLPSNTIYGSSKAAVISFTKNLASEMGQYNIRVNAIAPGAVRTEMIEPVKDYFEDVYMKSVALGKLAEAETIADAAMFLLSDASAYVTGQTLRVDGGKF